MSAAVDVVSRRLAALPLNVYDVRRDGSEAMVSPTDPEANVLARRWSAHTTALDGIQHFVESVMVDGYGAALVERANGADQYEAPQTGRLVAIHPLDPAGVNRHQVGRQLVYNARIHNSSHRVARDNIFFLPFKRPMDGVTDESPLARHWTAIRPRWPPWSSPRGTTRTARSPRSCSILRAISE